MYKEDAIQTPDCMPSEILLLFKTQIVAFSLTCEDPGYKVSRHS